jgi:hypothetical protein
MSNIGELLERDLRERPPHLRFSREAVENPVETQRQGISVSVDVDYVTVTQVGGGGNGVKWKINQARSYYQAEIRNGRMNPQWLADFDKMYALWKDGQELPVNGTPIRGWMLISAAQQANLIAKGIATVEDLAALNAEGAQRIGMGAIELKNRAIATLQAAKDVGPLVMKNAALEAQVLIITANYEDLKRKLDEMLSSQNRTGGEPTNYAIPDSSRITASDIIDNSESDLDDLKEQYQKKFGEPPHHRMKRETIERALLE